jgi:hypothetical protein
MAITNVIKTVFTASDQVTKVLSKIHGKIGVVAARMKASMGKMTKSLNAVSSKLTSGLKTGFAVAAGAAVGLYLAIDKLVGNIDGLNDTAKALNFPIEELQEWQYVAKQSGVDTELFEGSIKKFTKNFSEAKLGVGGFLSGIKKMNPALAKQMRATSDSAQAFELYIKAMQTAPDAATKNRLAFLAFGKSATSMINIANESADSIAGLRDEARKNGIVTAEQAANVAIYDDTMNRLKNTIMGFMNSALVPFIPILTELANETRDWMLANKEVFGKAILKGVDGLRAGLKWIFDNIEGIKTWAIRIGKVAAGFYTLVAVMNIINTAVALFNLLANANPYVAIIMGTLAALALIEVYRDEINEFMFGIFDWFVEVGSAIGNMASAWLDAVIWVFTPLTTFLEASADTWAAIIDFFRDVWDGNWSAIGARFVTAFDFIKSYYVAIWNGMVSFALGVWAVLGGMVDTFVDVWNGDWDAIGVRFAGVWDSLKLKAGEALDWIISKLGPVGKLIESIFGITGAMVGRIDVVPNVAGMDTPAPAKMGTDKLSPMFASKAPDVAGMDTPAPAKMGTGKLSPMFASKAPDVEQQSSQSPVYIPKERVQYATGESTNVTTSNTDTQKAEVTIWDKTKRAKVTRGKLASNVRLIHSGVM